MSMKYLLKSIHWLDAMTPPLEQHVRKLADVIRSLLKRSGPIVSAAARGTNPAICLPPDDVEKRRRPAAPAGPPAGRKRSLAPLLLLAVGIPLGVFGWWRLHNANPTPAPATEKEQAAEKPARPPTSSAAETVVKKNSTVAPKSTAEPKASNKPAAATTEPTASAAPAQTRRAGPIPFVPIFNGKDLTGWEPLPGNTAKWTVEDGAIVGRNGRGYLFSKRSDFAA